MLVSHLVSQHTAFKVLSKILERKTENRRRPDVSTQRGASHFVLFIRYHTNEDVMDSHVAPPGGMRKVHKMLSKYLRFRNYFIGAYRPSWIILQPVINTRSARVWTGLDCLREQSSSVISGE
jgi:hypothetical protein